jgi:hypothetical protein
MPKQFRRVLLLLSATWALLALVRLQPLQFSTEPSPWQLYALPAALTLALCGCPPKTWTPVAWFVTSATTLGAVGLLSWLPIGLSFLAAVPSPVGAPVVTLLLAATLFWFASQPAYCFAPWATHFAFAVLAVVSPLLLYNYTAAALFPVRMQASQSYGPHRFLIEARGNGGPIGARIQLELIRETPAPLPGLVWRYRLGSLPYDPTLTPTELVLSPTHRIPLEQLAGPNPDLSKM